MKSRSKDTQTPATDSELALEAADWLVRLTDTEFDPEEPYPDPLERQKAFVEWLRLAPAHVRIFLEILEVERRVGNPDPHHLVNIPELLAASRPTAISGSITAPRMLHATEPDADVDHSGAMRHRGHYWPMAAAVVMAGLAATLSGLLLTSKPVTASSIYYSSSVGERASITLEDGSRLTLSAATKVAVTYDRHTREVRLLQGEALFDVRHDADRPFRVFVDDIFLEDLGTQFDVDRRSNTTRISVVEGSVRLMCGCLTRDDSPRLPNEALQVRSVPAHPSTVLVLDAGNQVDVTVGNVTLIRRRQLVPQEMAHTIAWKDGELWFNGESLSSVVEAFNRYSTQRIVIADPTIANYRVIGGECWTPDIGSCAKDVESTAGVVVLPPNPAEPNTIQLGRRVQATDNAK